MEIYIPDDYVNIVKERLALYQELSQLKTTQELEAFEAKLQDRFGALPDAAKELIESVRLKWIAIQLGMERLILKKGSCLCYFLSDQQSNFFQSEGFSFLLNQIQGSPDQMQLKEKNAANGPKLLLSIREIKNVKSLIILLDKLVLKN
jgi:transcription-repair coupling factor (superfamily II helicase)